MSIAHQTRRELQQMPFNKNNEKITIKELMKLTEREKRVIRAYKKDDFVMDDGWESLEAGAWVKGFHEDCNMNGKEFSGVMSGLSKKGLIYTNSESFSLTEKGIEIARTL